MRTARTAITLLELVTALVLFSVLILAFSSIDTFSRYQMTTAQKRSVVQNELSYILEEITRSVVMATGHIDDPGIRADIAEGFRVRVDTNIPPTPGEYGDDVWINYSYSGYSVLKNGVALNKRQVILPVAQGGFNFEVLDNGTGVKVYVKGRHDPSQAASAQNPEIEMQMSVYSNAASAS